jgi:hypothetical protein
MNDHHLIDSAISVGNKSSSKQTRRRQGRKRRRDE